MEQYYMLNRVYNEARAVISELAESAHLKRGATVVVGCSTSEIVGSKIGTNSNPEIAERVYAGLSDAAAELGLYLAVQCCEHLNRAIIIEREAAKFAEEVNVIPRPKAGGSLATAAYKSMRDPIATERISADAGIDIGFTMIGMHLKRVAVPLRLSNNRIGEATVLAARTRPPFIGGSRAEYNESLL